MTIRRSVSSETSPWTMRPTHALLLASPVLSLKACVTRRQRGLWPLKIWSWMRRKEHRLLTPISGSGVVLHHVTDSPFSNLKSNVTAWSHDLEETKETNTIHISTHPSTCHSPFISKVKIHSSHQRWNLGNGQHRPSSELPSATTPYLRAQVATLSFLPPQDTHLWCISLQVATPETRTEP